MSDAAGAVGSTGSSGGSESSGASESSDSFDESSDSFDGTPEPKDNDSFDDDDSFEPKEKKEKKEEKSEKGDEKKPKVERYHTVQVNGKTVRVTESQLIAHFQKQEAAEEKFATASKLQKSSIALVEALKSNPVAVLTDPRLGIDRQAIAMALIKEDIEKELKEPHEVKLSETEAELKKYKDKEEQEQKRIEMEAVKKEHQATVQKIQTRLTETFSKAMELSPLSKDPETAAYALREMAIEYRLARSSGYEASPEELAEKVQQRYLKSMYSATNHMSGADLVAFLGKEVIKKLRAYDLEQLKGPKAKDEWTQSPREFESKPKPNAEPIDPNDYREKMRSMY